MGAFQAALEKSVPATDTIPLPNINITGRAIKPKLRP